MTSEQPTATTPRPGGIRQVLLGVVWTLAWLGAIQLLLLVIAGRPGWTAAWTFTGLSAAIFTINLAVLARTNPGVIAARLTARRGLRSRDAVATSVMALGYLGSLVVPAMGQRLGWSGAVGPLGAAGGILLYMLGNAGLTWAMAANPFFEPIVRVQSERGHRVITGGPYQFVRHPGYTSGACYLFAQPLVLGSAWGLLPAAVAVAAMIARTVLEDGVLRRELPGYAEYAARVPWRLLPWVW